MGSWGKRPVERLGRRRPPVDNERVAVLVGDGQATYVEAAAVDEVEATDEQTVLGDVERGQPMAGVRDGAVALEQRLGIPGLGEPRPCAAMPSAEPRMASDPVVGGIEVRALPAQLVVTEHDRG